MAPEIDLSLRFRKSNPIFARGEMSRYVLDVLWEAEKPLLMRQIARSDAGAQVRGGAGAGLARATGCHASYPRCTSAG